MFVGRMSEAAEVITQYVSPDAGDVAPHPEAAPAAPVEFDAFQEVAAPAIASPPPAPPELAVDAPTMRVGFGGVLVPKLEVAAPAVVKAADEGEIEPAELNGHVRVAGENYTVIKGEIYAVSVQAPVSKESPPTALERNVDALIAKHAPNADSAARARLSYLLLSIGKQTNKRSPEGLKQLLSFKEIAALLDASKPTLAESSPPSANPGGRPRSRAP